MANYAWTTGKPLPTAENGQTFDRVIFTRKEPHTKIYEGVTGLTFTDCKMTNCDVPEDATLIRCKTGHREYCGNANPKMVERGILAPCAENCSHVTDSDTIVIDSVSVLTVYHYADKQVV